MHLSPYLVGGILVFIGGLVALGTGLKLVKKRDSASKLPWSSKPMQFTEEIERLKNALLVFFLIKNENGKQVRYEKEVPRTYVLENNVYVPYYPVPSYLQRINVEMIAFDRAMAEISEGDPDKKNYTILTFILEILVYDKNLTAYYASRSELGESFAITTNESDYTNISGGRGIFGSFIKQRFAVRFTHEYIKSFGYEPGLTSSINE